MGFLNRLRGIPDENLPAGVATAATAAMAAPAEFDLRGLPEPDAKAREAMAAGNLIAAVKSYRAQAGLELGDAKRVIDALARGDRFVGRSTASGASPSDGSAVLDSATASVDSAAARIDGLIADGKLIAAVKLHRETHGTGLKEAKDAVEARKDELSRGE